MTVADQSDARDASASSADHVAERAGPYVSRMLIQHLATAPDKRTWTGEGTAAFVDISGFTKLSESLAKKGRVGAEQVADSIGGVFESMLSVAYASGGSLLKFGGDALLLWFDGEQHAREPEDPRGAARAAACCVRRGNAKRPRGTASLELNDGFAAVTDPRAPRRRCRR